MVELKAAILSVCYSIRQFYIKNAELPLLGNSADLYSENQLKYRRKRLSFLKEKPEIFGCKINSKSFLD